MQTLNLMQTSDQTLYVQAQYNAPVADLGTAGVPAYRVRVACDFLSDSSLEGSDLLAAMVDALAVFTANASIANGCLDITGASAEPEPEPPGTASAPASYIAALAPAAAPEAAPAGAAQPELSSSQKFGYQVCAVAVVVVVIFANGSMGEQIYGSHQSHHLHLLAALPVRSCMGSQMHA